MPDNVVKTGLVNKEELKTALLFDRRTGSMNCATMKVIYEIIDECEEVTYEIPVLTDFLVSRTCNGTNGTDGNNITN